MAYKNLTQIPGKGGGPSKILPQFMEYQSQTNWCWAACGASVGNYYYGPSTYTQCGIANTCQEKTTCCTNPGGCNHYGYLDEALKAAKSFDRMEASTTLFSTLQSRINSNQPVGTRVAWNGGGSHFMMVTGYNTDGNKITIQDPWYGTSTIMYSYYLSSYQGSGSWTHTYYTRKMNISERL